MPVDSKVIWSEGMFIRAQHFQQEARYLEGMTRHLFRGIRGYGWGLSELNLNRDLLSIGKFAVERASGIFPDGTPFDWPSDVDEEAMRPLDLDENARGQIVYLTLPKPRPGGLEAADGSADAITRYVSHDVDTVDSSAIDAATASITVGRLRLCCALQNSERGGLLSLGIARINEVRSDNTILLDEAFIPPMLDMRVSSVVSGFVTEIVGLLNHRGEAIASRLAAGSEGTSGELSDTLMLQAVNRWQPAFAHLSTASVVHPETVYVNMISLAGELATFARANHRPPAFPVYDHDNLQATFAAVMMSLRQGLSAVLERGALAIPLVQHRYGIRVAEVPDRSIYTKYTFVLVTRADMPTETLMKRLVGQAKVGPVEQIRELVNAALPGIRLRGLSAAPRQVPYHTGKAYFELDKTSAAWKQLASSSALAIHVAGDFPGLELELWAVKD
ncbi:MAG TPA: type VI secretion system baseplate subunit TssK [Rhizobiaceae bacterium]|nr:type VI secretion system baseplate subunit TssK [Rhizobiaceae bacterium]